MRTPPTTTPTPETSSVAAPQSPIAVPRLAPVKTLVRIDIEDGIRNPPPIPEIAMPPIRTSAVGAAAAMIEPIANSVAPIRNIRLRPKMSEIRPAAIRSAVIGM